MLQYFTRQAPCSVLQVAIIRERALCCISLVRGQPHLVIVDGSKIADDVDDSKDKSAFGQHCQVRSTLVAINRVPGTERSQVLPHLHAMHDVLSKPMTAVYSKAALFR